ncbi:hypothetical protein EVAR_89067_1 [Eumeta japonica]|uniref:Uncharacterized protein n=1 Tax=Eumeta variegata TaxID=151549 RepID=A0A4C1XLX6_EUMVA|nr:hypothetical protein EVAR_89067_1 [Eumeta japonica]
MKALFDRRPQADGRARSASRRGCRASASCVSEPPILITYAWWMGPSPAASAAATTARSQLKNEDDKKDNKSGASSGRAGERGAPAAVRRTRSRLPPELVRDTVIFFYILTIHRSNKVYV